MMDYEFDAEFNKLVANQWEYGTNMKEEKIREVRNLYIEKLRSISAQDWKQVVSMIIDTETKFPSFSKIFAISRKIIGSREQVDYEYCDVCYGTGYVSIYLSFDFNNDGKKKIKEKHFWTTTKHEELKRDKPDQCFYSYAFHCRCQRGEDSYNIRDRKGYRLSHDEFNEVLGAESKEKENE